MFLAQTHLNGGKPRPPPVPPRPNKQIIDEAMARSKMKITAPIKNGVPIQNKLNGQFRADLGQHVHENGQKRPTVLLITNGKTVSDDVFKSKTNGDSVNKVRAGSESPKVTFQSSGSDSPRIKHSNWYQVDENSGKPVQYSSCRIILDGDSTSSDSSPVQRFRSSSMSGLQGLPPLPKSLSGVNLLESVRVTTPPTPVPDSLRTTSAPPTDRRNPPPPPRKMTSLDNKLSILRKEMRELREMDLSLLSQLWSLNESIQEFRQMQEAHFPPSPSSDVEDDVLYSNLATLPEHQPYDLSSSSSRSSTMDMGDV